MQNQEVASESVSVSHISDTISNKNIKYHRKRPKLGKSQLLTTQIELA